MVNKNQKASIRQAQDKDQNDKRTQELENQLKRVLADYQNLEKRVAQERSEWIKSGNKGLIIKLLPVLDDLMNANEHLKNEGLGLIIQKFLGILAQEGVTLVASLRNTKFDANIMEPIGTGEGEEGRVIEQVRPAYKQHDHVLRHAQVIVGQRKSEVTNIPNDVQEEN